MLYDTSQYTKHGFELLYNNSRKYIFRHLKMFTVIDIYKYITKMWISFQYTLILIIHFVVNGDVCIFCYYYLLCCDFFSTYCKEFPFNLIICMLQSCLHVK